MYQEISLTASPEAYSLIKFYEASNSPDLTAYMDPGDGWTIGWGHLSSKDSPVYEGMIITEAEAERLLEEDVQWAVDTINRMVKVPLWQNQFDALVSFVYNIGSGQFSTSTLLKKLNREDYEGAAEEFPRWVYDQGKKQKGLVKRRRAEQALFLP